jgi:hypothetical protein
LPPSRLSWRITYGPYFENEVATIELRDRDARLRLERTPSRELRLECVLEAPLT